MIIDAHHHLWKIGQHGQSWPTADLGTIYRDFLPENLAATVANTGVNGTVVVQSQASSLDTDWLLSVTRDVSLIQGIVAWADLGAPNAATRIAQLARHPKVKGLRPMLQNLVEDDWILRPRLGPTLHAMQDHNLSFDALVFTRHLPSIDTLAKTWPKLRIIIDHGAKPPIARALSHPDETRIWREHMSRVADNSNVTCKLSGLVTEMAPGQSLDVLTPYADHLLDIFGPERLMWGSDWPVLDMNGSYDVWLDWTLGWLSGKSVIVRDSILNRTAHTLYQLA